MVDFVSTGADLKIYKTHHLRVNLSLTNSPVTQCLYPRQSAGTCMYSIAPTRVKLRFNALGLPESLTIYMYVGALPLF
jgi:2-phospho-L-lactate guanylyltransferase (CobY/MobA/RfbA family)